MKTQITFDGTRQAIDVLTKSELLNKYGIRYTDDWQKLNQRFEDVGKHIFYCAGCVGDIWKAIENERETVDNLPPFTYISVNNWIMAL